MPEISHQALWNSMLLPAIGQTSHFQTLQTEDAIAADTASTHSMADFTPLVELNGNDIPGGPQCAAVNHAYDTVLNREGLPVTSLSRGNRDKRKRNSNWAEEETSILVKCKKEAATDNASRFCKGKGGVTNWDSIAEEINSNLGTASISKTGDQCRLRWDTLVKSYQKLKEFCSTNNKPFSELTRLEMVELKLATTLSEVEWFEVIDQFCPPKSRKSKSQKLDIIVSSEDTPAWSLQHSAHSNLPTQIGMGSLEARESSSREAGAMQDVAGFNTVRSDLNPVTFDQPVQTEVGSLEFQESPRRELVTPGWNVMNGEFNPVGFVSPLPTQSPVAEPRKSSGKQVAIRGFNSMTENLKFTILNLVQAWPTLSICGRIEKVCRWLAIVQDRSRSEIFSDVLWLLTRNPPTISISFYAERALDFKRLRVYKKFCKVVVSKDLEYDVHNRVLRDNSMLSFELSSESQRIRVLTLFECAKLERVDLAKLPMLRSLSIQWCSKLKAIIGWENPSRLGWLQITGCDDLQGEHLRVNCLPSLKEVFINRINCSKSDDLNGYKLDFSQCVRLRTVKIVDNPLIKSVDVSTLRCLEVVAFSRCPALESVVGLSESHSLIKVQFYRCPAMERLPYVEHLNALAKLKLSYSGTLWNTGFENLHMMTQLEVKDSGFETWLPDLGSLKALTHLEIWLPGMEEIRGLQKLHSLTTLDLSGCKALKRLPNLGDLKALRYLSICYCAVDEIPGVRDLVNMELLRCRGSGLEWLPDLSHLPRLREVELFDTPLVRASSLKYFGKSFWKSPVKGKEGGESAEEIADVSDADYVPSDQELYDEYGYDSDG